ncbi:DUF6443 domain-containing protein [Pedobacter nototheniae]|uniref:DUF6443 domain-containing protein n=1 Tax=Pedobacter nototheniae TaxID=2488994 RepID=UPI0013F3DD16|nr:DUF6443 domain-containing protein [Pedobacter nototheniae]
MKRYLIYTIIVFTEIVISALPVLSQNKTFVQQEVVKIEGVLTDGQLSTLTPLQKQVTRTYSDGFGRVQQIVVAGGSPNGKDLIQHKSYDNIGRESKIYLPYASLNNNAAFRSNAVAEQNAFYSTAGQKTATDSSPFSQQVFENSPLQRVLQLGSVGAGFQPGEHYKTMAYGTNLSSETIRRWQPDGNDAGIWPAGTLDVSMITDESGTKTAVYTDAMGQTVLKRQWLGQGGISWLNTFYVYDDLGQLVFAIPPKAFALMESLGNYTLSQPEVAKLIFSYVYDEKGRPIEKTVPGSSAVYMVYDRMDRLVLAQDGNLRTQGKWNYIKYDSRQNPVSQGIYNDGSSRTAMQAYVSAINYNNTYFEVRNGDGATGFYTNNTFPASNIEPLAYSYFDNYDLDGNGTPDYVYQTQGLNGEATATDYISGLPTIIRKRTVGTGLSNIWLSTVMFYNRKGQLIQTLGNNQLNANLASVKTLVRDFTGKTKLTKIIHAGATTVTIQTAYTFDHMDRLKIVDESYNGATAVRVAAYEYNEIGQLVDKKLHSTNAGSSYLQSVDYRYNIRGQLTSINNGSLTADSRNDDTNDVFGMELLYDQTDASLGNTSYYNGMISAVKWKTNAPGVTSGNEKSYRFNYDALLRLTSANYADRSAGNGWGNIGAFDEKNISYDLNGNILSLQRNAILNGNITAVDDLNYSYDGNRLSNVADGAGGSYNVFGFKNLTGSVNSYVYADNGNLTVDPKKGLGLSYNVLNRTERIMVNTASGRYIDYTYDAGGSMIRKQAIDNGALVKTTDYIEGFVYENGTLAYFGATEGRVRNAAGNLKQEYIIKDQQGNARVSFEEQNGIAVVRQENSYYPFGLSMPGNTVPTAANKNLYNRGSEWQDDFGDLPDLQQTFFRMYDAALGRFIAVDPMAEASESFGTYHYSMDNPVMFNDPMGDLTQQGDPGGRSNEPQAVNFHGGYGRIGAGSGNHWSDGIGYGDWSAWNGSDSYRWAISQGFSDTNGVLSKTGEGGVQYGYKSDGKYGYWSNDSIFQTGTTSYFNAVTGKVEQSVNTGDFVSTWHMLNDDQTWKDFANGTSKVNWGLTLGTTSLQNISGSVRLSTVKLGFSPKYYSNAWTGNRYAKTFNVGKIGAITSRGLVVAGIAVDGYSWYKGDISDNKMTTNTTMALWGLTGVGTVPSIFYFGAEAFVPGGFEGLMNGAEQGFAETKRILGPSWRPMPLGGK